MTKRSIVAWILCAVATVLLGVWLYTDHFAAIAVAFVVLLPAFFMFNNDLAERNNQNR